MDLSLLPFLPGKPHELLFIELKLPLLPLFALLPRLCLSDTLLTFMLLENDLPTRSAHDLGRPHAKDSPRIQLALTACPDLEPHLQQLKVLHRTLLRLILAALLLLLLLLDAAVELGLQALDLLVLAEQVLDGAFAAEEIAVVAGDGVAAALETEVAGVEGLEGVAGEASPLLAVVAFEQGAFVRAGERGVLAYGLWGYGERAT